MKNKIILILASIIVTVLALLLAWFYLNKNLSFKFGSSRAAVITQIQSLSKLETASYTVDKIIEASTDYNKLNQILFGDKLLLIAHGQVVAGYDLSKLSNKDFSGSGSNININLPQAEIFSVNIDNNQTRVFDRKQGLFTKGELNLESEARQQAQDAIKQAACDGGILDDARKNAKSQLELIFKAAGFQSVTVIDKYSNTKC